MEYLILWNLWRNEVCNLFISKERCTIMTYYKNILQKCWRGISNLNNKIYAVVHKNSMIFLLVKYVQRARYRSIVKTLDISHKIVLNHLKKIRFARKIYILVIWVFWINSIDRIIIREMLLKHNEMEIFQKQPKKQKNIFFFNLYNKKSDTILKSVVFIFHWLLNMYTKLFDIVLNFCCVKWKKNHLWIFNALKYKNLFLSFFNIII